MASDPYTITFTHPKRLPPDLSITCGDRKWQVHYSLVRSQISGLVNFTPTNDLGALSLDMLPSPEMTPDELHLLLKFLYTGAATFPHVETTQFLGRYTGGGKPGEKTSTYAILPKDASGRWRSRATRYSHRAGKASGPLLILPKVLDKSAKLRIHDCRSSLPAIFRMYILAARLGANSMRDKARELIVEKLHQPRHHIDFPDMIAPVLRILEQPEYDDLVLCRELAAKVNRILTPRTSELTTIAEAQYRNAMVNAARRSLFLQEMLSADARQRVDGWMEQPDTALEESVRQLAALMARTVVLRHDAMAQVQIQDDTSDDMAGWTTENSN